MKILVTTYPFSQAINDHEVIYNTKKMKYSQEEIYNILKRENPDIIIAGTEEYQLRELNVCTNLKLISRVGVGISSIDFDECDKRGIQIKITPSAPTNAVSELTIANILLLIRKLHLQKMWNKKIGKEINECTIGIIGHGKIGKNVVEKIKIFNPKKILINDIAIKNSVNLEEIFYLSDVISFHTPNLDKKITFSDLEKMKKDVCIINTSRGNLFNEKDLYEWLKVNPMASAAIDGFENEPYINGDLCKLDNVFLTPHIGSYTNAARNLMEKEAVKNVLNFIKKDTK